MAEVLNSNTTETFRSSIERAKKRLGVSVKNAWFRGQTNTWTLTSTLTRFLGQAETQKDFVVNPREVDFFSEFLFRNDEYTIKNCTSWEILAVMQHYGLPTRLIDWTENFYVALFFALEKHIQGKAESSHTPCIFIINPYTFSKIAMETSCGNPFKITPQDTAKVWDVTLNTTLDYNENVLKCKKWFFKTPLPIFSPWRNPRISAQRGFFTVDGYDSTALENQSLLKDEVRRIDIPKEAIPGLISMLSDAGINHFTLFRDLESLTRFLKSKYALLKADTAKNP
jgi:FRG domain